MSTESVSPDTSIPSGQALSRVERIDQERILKYKRFAVAFSYPDDSFFGFFPELSSKREELIAEYDRLFRISSIWLYGTEYLAKNEFQRANLLSDIMGFYKAFGVEPGKVRPDSLSSELEFMHYLIYKRLRALKLKDRKDTRQKQAVCLDCQKKFFSEHLLPAAKRIAEKIIARSKDGFYKEASLEMLNFLKKEKRCF